MIRRGLLLLPFLPACLFEDGGPCFDATVFEATVQLQTSDGTSGELRRAWLADESPAAPGLQDPPLRFRSRRVRDPEVGWLEPFVLEVDGGVVRVDELQVIVDGERRLASFAGSCLPEPEPGLEWVLECEIDGELEGEAAQGSARIEAIRPGCE